MQTPLVITIDGSAGSGKSTAARKLAARLEIAYLDTGAMYRALALKMIQDDLSPDDCEALTQMADRANLEVDCGPTYQRIRLDGHDVSEAIRSMKVSRNTSYIARVPEIRAILVEHQRRLGLELKAFVTEGRDQGAVVFPDADIKFVLDAATSKRAERRFIDVQAEGEPVTYDDVLRNLLARDKNDKVQWAPLLVPGQAIQIDTTDMTISQVVDALEAAVRERIRVASPASP